MATRDYVGDGIVVHWDAERCFHSERCVTGLPAVFDRDRRPWVDAGAAPADRIAAVIDTCPSGALSYTRTDGVANGRRGRTEGDAPEASIAVDEVWVPPIEGPPETEVVITPLRNGPLWVAGPVTLRLPDGSMVETRVQLCRCGHSGSKPRCDGSHARVGFTADGLSPRELTS